MFWLVFTSLVFSVFHYFMHAFIYLIIFYPALFIFFFFILNHTLPMLTYHFHLSHSISVINPLLAHKCHLIWMNFIFDFYLMFICNERVIISKINCFHGFWILTAPLKFVLMIPGATQFTLTLMWAHSLARTFVKPSKAVLLTL